MEHLNLHGKKELLEPWKNKQPIMKIPIRTLLGEQLEMSSLQDKQLVSLSIPFWGPIRGGILFTVYRGQPHDRIDKKQIKIIILRYFDLDLRV